MGEIDVENTTTSGLETQSVRTIVGACADRKAEHSIFESASKLRQKKARELA